MIPYCFQIDVKVVEEVSKMCYVSRQITNADWQKIIVKKCYGTWLDVSEKDYLMIRRRKWNSLKLNSNDEETGRNT